MADEQSCMYGAFAKDAPATLSGKPPNAAESPEEAQAVEEELATFWEGEPDVGAEETNRENLEED